MKEKKKETKFNLTKSFNLLKEGFYQEVIEEPTFIILVSIFKDKSYNYIMPKVTLNYIDLSSINSFTEMYEKKGYKFSLYINDNLFESYKGYLISNKFKEKYNDLFVYKWNDRKFPIEDLNIVEVNSGNLKKFIKSANICFPDWDTNKSFTEWCYESPYVKMYGVEKDKEIISFGAYYIKDDSDYIMLMNDGTLPEYRRQGLHNNLLKFRINQCLEDKNRACFYSNVEPESNSHNSYLKEEFENSCLIGVYSD